MTRPSALSLVVALVLGLTSVAPPSHAAPGGLDPTFGGGFGRVRTPVGGSLTFSQFNTSEVSGQPSIALQPDGKIVVAGSCKIDATYDFCLIRHNSNGNLDTTFGSNGLVKTDVQGADDLIAGVAIQPDGKIVVAGTCESNIFATRKNFCLVRYTATGALDTSFSNDGKLTTSFTSFDDVATSVALQADGKIVLSGYCANNVGDINSSATFGIEVCLARYTSAGTLDTSFNGDGKLVTSIGGAISTRVRNKANAIAIAADGKIVVTGSNYTGTTASFGDTNLLLLRFLPNGTLDTTFSSDGIVTVTTPDWIVGNAVAIQPDNLVVVVGYAVSGCSAPVACAVALRFTETGALDSTFGVFGRVDIAHGNPAKSAFTYSVALQNDGKIVLAGHCAEAGGRRSFCFARLNAEGGIDKSFAANGFGSVQFDAFDYDYGFGVAVQSDGKIVLGGFCSFSPNPDFCVARLEGGPFGARNCSLDIDGDGKVLATTDSLIHARIALGITGSAVIGGITFPADATRNLWGGNGTRDIRKYLNTQCGMALP